MNEKILKLFGKAISTADKIPFEQMFKAAVKLGYLVHPDICQGDVLLWLNNQKFNPNSTFYKSWNDIVSKNRIELLVEQVIHYFSTYGTDFTGTPYIPNNTPAEIDITNYKTILPITEQEVISRCEKMFFSGIALKQETIEDVLSIFDALNYNIEVEKVKNREAKMFLFDKLNQLPVASVEMIRFLIYKATGSSLLIKSKETFEAISNSKLDVTDYINNYGYEKLASVFLRYKPIFLAFRKNEKNKSCINKLRKLAVQHHKPIGKPFIETILSDINTIAALPEKLKHINNFKKILLLQAINVRKKSLNTRAFIIRNQKLFVKEESINYEKHYDIVYAIIYNSLIENLKRKACKISLPEGVTLTLPTSEKSFIGNYPLGTSFDLSKHDTIIGINWRKEDGADDLDLSLVDITGNRIGWNAAYYNTNKSLVYSGDMTSADPEATELIYASKGFDAGIVKVNLYRGEARSKLKLFVAKEKITDMQKNYMVNPNNVLFTIDSEMDSREKSFAVLSNDKMILAQFKTGKGRVSGNSVTNKYTEYALETSDCYLSLSKVLSDAGFEITNKSPQIDLRELSKDALINLIGNYEN